MKGLTNALEIALHDACRRGVRYGNVVSGLHSLIFYLQVDAAQEARKSRKWRGDAVNNGV